jgi:hypothetical protein
MFTIIRRLLLLLAGILLVLSGCSQAAASAIQQPNIPSPNPGETATVAPEAPTVEVRILQDTHMPEDSSVTQDPSPASSIIWQAKHESGDLREWQQHGDFIRQGQSAYYSMVTPHAHTGKYSVALTIDTEGYSDTGDFAAYLFFWDQLPGDAYYYSAWYYIPSGTQPQDWWNIWQWKSTYDGNTDNSVPMYILDILEKPNGQLALHLVFRPDTSNYVDYRQDKMTVPTDQWFQIEAYYQKGVDNNGQVTVWQDGSEIINITNVPTTMEDNTVYWSVNHYTDNIVPSPSTIYIDDAAISTQRIGPNFTLP